MIVQDLNFDQTVAMAEAKAESMIQNGLYSRFGLSEKERLDKALLGCIYNPKNEKSVLEKRKRKVRLGRRKNENGKFPDTHTKKRQRLNVNKTVFKRCLFMQKNTQKVIVNSEKNCIFT